MSNFPVKKRFWPIFSRIMESDKPQGWIQKGPRGFLTIIVQMIKIIFLWHKRSKGTTPSKNSCFHSDKNLGPFFFLKSLLQTSGNNLEGSTNYFNIYCGRYKVIYLEPKRLLRKKKCFERKKISPVKKSFWPMFTRIIETDKPQDTNHKGPQGTLTTFVEVIRSLLWDLRGRQKQTFRKS